MIGVSDRRQELITIRVPRYILSYLDEVAAREGVTRSEIIRHALREWVLRHAEARV